VADERPVFLFDRGHQARAFRDFYPVGVDLFYGGRYPEYLDPAEDLDADRLARLAAAQRPALREIRERLARAPTPAECTTAMLGAR
jgi:hypothetical protein